MDGYIFDAELDERQRERAVALFCAPGEQVTVSDRIVSHPVGRNLLDAGENGILTISAVHIEQGDQTFYEFREIDGRHHDSMFVDVRPTMHVYGTLSEVDGETWLVALNESDGKSEVISAEGSCFRLTGVTGRWVSWDLGLNSKADLDELAAEGGSGEYVIRQDADGTWLLAAMPWSSGMSEDERAVSEDAVAIAKQASGLANMGMLH